MTVPYKTLQRELKGKRKNLTQVCDELGIDYDEVDFKKLDLEQCSHCSTWTKDLTPDLDDNPICKFCVTLIGL